MTVPPGASSHPTSTSYVIVRLGGELFALAAALVREITRLHPLTPVPGAPAALPGIVRQRGAILPVIDPRIPLGLATGEPGRATRLICCHVDHLEAMLLVDAVHDLAELPPETLEPLPTALDPARARFLHALARIGTEPVAVLDLAALIDHVRTGVWS